MKYYEYKATGENVLLDLNGFDIGDIMCSMSIKTLIEVTKSDGKYFNDKYIDELRKLDEDEEKIDNLKNLIKEELIVKGYNLDHLVEPIVHGE